MLSVLAGPLRLGAERTARMATRQRAFGSRRAPLLLPLCGWMAKSLCIASLKALMRMIQMLGDEADTVGDGTVLGLVS
jgi:hypothetical protein